MGLHTDIPSRREIERLLRARGDNLVSIHLPTSPITPEADAARITFKNLAAEAVGELRAGSAGTADREAIKPALDDLRDDSDFWTEQAHSLAVLIDPHGLRSFRLPNRLTAAIQVADRYYVKPLLRTITFPQTAFVLALAEGSVRLLEVTPDLPTFEVRVPICDLRSGCRRQGFDHRPLPGPPPTGHRGAQDAGPQLCPRGGPGTAGGAGRPGRAADPGGVRADRCDLSLGQFLPSSGRPLATRQPRGLDRCGAGRSLPRGPR